MKRAALLAMLLCSCAQGPVGALPSPAPAASAVAPLPRADPSISPTRPEVVLIAMENTAPQVALGQPYLASLAERALVFSSFRAVGHPSLPNYLALTSGQTWSIRDDGYYVGPGDKIPKVTGSPITGPKKHNDGDVIEVSGLRINFIFRE